MVRVRDAPAYYLRGISYILHKNPNLFFTRGFSKKKKIAHQIFAKKKIEHLFTLFFLFCKKKSK